MVIISGVPIFRIFTVCCLQILLFLSLGFKVLEDFKPIALRKPKTPSSFGYSECNNVRYASLSLGYKQYISNLSLGYKQYISKSITGLAVVVVVLLFYVHSKHLRSCQVSQLT